LTENIRTLLSRNPVPGWTHYTKLNQKPRKFKLLLPTLYPAALTLTPTLQLLEALTQLINSSLEMRTGASVEVTASLRVYMVRVEERLKETLVMATVS